VSSHIKYLRIVGILAIRWKAERSFWYCRYYWQTLWSFQRSPRNKSSVPFANASAGHTERTRFAMSRLYSIICLSYLNNVRIIQP